MAGFSNGAYRAALGTGTSAGGVLALANPEGEDLYLTDLILDVTTQSTGASTVDAGIAANGTTSADNLIDGKSLATAGAFTNHTDGGSNGKAGQKWGASQYLTISQASGAVAGLEGYAIVKYVKLGA